MKLWDVNLWVYAFRPDSPLHARAREEIENTLGRREPFLFSSGVASSFLRLVTNPRIFKNPSPLRDAWDFVDVLESHPAAFHTEYDAMALGIFKHLCVSRGLTGNSVPDAYLAALALRHDATLFTADKAFVDFTGLEVFIV